MSRRLLLTTNPTLIITSTQTLLRPHLCSLRPLIPSLSSPSLSSNLSPIRTMASASAAKRLAGKTVLVTGASSGIGRSTALEFARTAPDHGLRLILAARRVETLEQIARDIRAEVGEGVKVLPFKLDVSNPAEAKGVVDNLPEEWRDIDVLVNNACVPLHTLSIRVP